MKLHLGSIGDHAWITITTEHVDLAGVPTTKDMKKNKEHNQTMLEIGSALSYDEFDDIKGCTFSYQMWEALSNIYGGDQNFQRGKREIRRRKFDEIIMPLIFYKAKKHLDFVF